MPVRLHITMDDELYRRLKDTCPPRSISRYISDAVRARLYPDQAALEAGYRAASREAWRTEFADAWKTTEVEDLPE